MNIPFAHAVMLSLYLAMPFAESGAIVAQELEPIDGRRSFYSAEYNIRLREVLLKKTMQFNEFQFLMAPSFTPEMLLTVWKTKDSTYLGEVVQAEEHLFYNKAADSSLPVNKARKVIPSEIAERTIELWSWMLKRTRYQEKKTFSPRDGVGYTFFRHDRYYGAMSGQCINPREGSRPALLAKIGALLIAYVKAEPGAEKEIADQLVERMDLMDSQIDALE